MKKKLFVLLIALAMVMSFAACGGGGSSEEAAAPAAEPNTGLAGIVFAVPDGWTLTQTDVDNYLQYDPQDSGFLFSANTVDQSDIDSMGSDEIKTVQDFYEKQFLKMPDTEGKGYTNEISDIKVCDTDAKYAKAVRDDKTTFEISTNWLMDDVIYSVSVFYPVDYDENGKPTKEFTDFPAMSEDLMKAYDDVIASIQAGDGKSLQPAGLPIDSLDGFSFVAPENYPVTYAEEKSISMNNKENGNTIFLQRVDQEAFENFNWEGEGLPTTLEEYFESGKIDSESVEIAGYEGYVNKYPAEDGKIYDVHAGFMADGVVYEINMYADAYDENGLKADAVPLSDEDFAVFDGFLASIAKK
ncbi:MAG: hypothetical protein IKI38_01745 [Mogibacterium sp.]|nr:hypothetical protein [Mogibacterium sp.]